MRVSRICSRNGGYRVPFLMFTAMVHLAKNNQISHVLNRYSEQFLRLTSFLGVSFSYKIWWPFGDRQGFCFLFFRFVFQFWVVTSFFLRCNSTITVITNDIISILILCKITAIYLDDIWGQGSAHLILLHHISFLKIT